MDFTLSDEHKMLQESIRNFAGKELWPIAEDMDEKDEWPAAIAAYKEAGVTKPREEIGMFEVHDCFSITELLTYEDLQLSARGKAVEDIDNGFYDLDGKIPCNPDGGLKSFGHPIGATGVRMIYEMYLQLQGKAGKRQIENPKLGLTHNLGGFPAYNLVSVSIVGKDL